MKKAVVFLFAAVFATIPAAAEKPWHLTASETISYDDNIYLTDSDTKDSMISTTRLGADYKALIPSTSLQLVADVGVGYNAYTEDHNRNNYWEANGGFGIANDNLILGDRILYTSDPANSSLTQRKKRLNNTGYVSYQTSREKMFGFGVSAMDSYDRYFESNMQYLTRNRLNLGAQVFYNMTAKTQFFVEYMFSDITYKDNKYNNSIGNRLGVGVNGHIASKIAGTAKITYDMRDYDHSLAGADDYNDLLGYFVALTWKPTARNTVRLSGERKMEETRWATNRYFADTIVSLYASHKLSDKLTAAVTLSWENMAYAKKVQNTKRDDNLYVVRPEIDYQFKEWLSAGVWYQFRTRHSNWTSADYDSNKAGAFVKAIF